MEKYKFKWISFSCVCFMLNLTLLILMVFWILTFPSLAEVNSLHINCGGRQISIGGITYEEDTDPGAPAIYKLSRDNWAFSNTGHFLDNNTVKGLLPYTSENKTVLCMTDSELYKNARISPIALTYYGFCLKNGDYTVKLHFAEIMFTDDNTFSSLGRRVFDVYIQVHGTIIFLILSTKFWYKTKGFNQLFTIFL